MPCLSHMWIVDGLRMPIITMFDYFSISYDEYSQVPKSGSDPDDDFVLFHLRVVRDHSFIAVTLVIVKK